MKTFHHFLFAIVVGACISQVHAQESCYEQYFREHNKKILTAEDADDSYDELKKTVLAKQMYGDSYLLMVDTVAQRAVITKVDGTYIADVHVALVDSTWYMWLSVDPLADKYPGNTPYMYCNGNPIRFIDPDGEAWKATFSYDTDGNSTPNGFEWIDESLSYDKDGNLKRGLYHQAIFFSENGTFSKDSKFNVGSSTATVYLADGSTKSYNACTYPSSLTSYPTIPEGVYVASVGLHRDKYLALKMRNINASKQQIKLGFTNPAHPDCSYIEGANIHKAGKNNYTGIGQDGKAVSEGCFLIDRNSWDDFIGNFTCVPNTPVGIGVSRTLPEPINVNRFPAFNFILNYFFK